MDLKLRNPLIAAAVSAVLSNSAFAATAGLPTSQALPNFDQNAALAIKQSANPSIVKSTNRASRTAATKPAVNNRLKGQQINHFDRDLNRHTFSWANTSQKTAARPFAVLSRGAAIEQSSRHYAASVGVKHGVSAKALTEAELKYHSDNQRGAIISKYQQKANGLDVYGRQLNVLMNQNMELVATSGYFSSAIAPNKSKQKLAAQFGLSAEEAIGKAFINIGGQSLKLSKADNKADYQRFKASSDNYTFSDLPRGKKVYYPGQKKLIPAYYVEFMASRKGSVDLSAYSLVVSAVDGTILNRTNMVQSDSFTYKVFADSAAPYTPYDSPAGNELSPHPTGVYNDRITEPQARMNSVTLEHSGISTNDPWLPADATVTSGNNVNAYADLVAPDGFNEGDVIVSTSSANTFDYPFAHDGRVDSEENRNAAIVNLFYVNNYLHDLYYDHGFDEAAGVAQVDNYGRGGIDGDPINAEAQDQGGINNATMATPADGSSPTMNMFFWQENSTRDGTMDNPIIEHEWGHYITSRLTNGGLYANNQGGSMGEGWGDFFALMTMAREEDQLLPGNDRWQGTYNDGGYAVNNGYVEHAYFFGLRRAPYTTDMNHNAFTFKHIADQEPVPRSHPINGRNTSDYEMNGGANAEVHNAGEIWALMLWESYVGLLNRDELDFVQAQSRMRDYMVASLKITPFAPTYTEARDALLAVALANDIEDYNVIRTAFAKRGMGVGAVSPARFDAGWDRSANSQGHAGVVESFEVTGSAIAVDSIALDTSSNTVNGAYCDVDGVLDAGETAMLTLGISNMGTLALSGIKAKVSSDADITFANDGMIDFADLAQWRDTTSASVAVTLNSGRINEVVGITVSFISDDPSVFLPEDIRTSINVNYDLAKNREIEDFEDAELTWTDWTRSQLVDNGGIDPVHILGRWEVYDDIDFGNIAFGPNLSQSNDISLTSPAVTVADNGDFAIEFDHYFDFEFGDVDNSSDETTWDGGVMEVSIDNGEWTDVVAAGGSFLTGYNGAISNTNPILPGRDGFVGLIESFWIESESLTFPDGVLNGKEVKFRFRIGTDQSVWAWGWNIDNVKFVNAATATPFSSLVEDNGVCVNRAPFMVATDGPDSVVENSEVTLTANGLDHDATELSYAWVQTAGSVVIDLGDSNGAALTFTAPLVSADEVYTFSVMASDGQLSSASREVSVTIIANAAPVVTTEQTTASVKEKQLVTLSVAGSDAEGQALTYQWAMDGVVLDNHTETFEYAAPAVSQDTDVVFSVTAFDGIERSEVTQIALKVVANVAPVVIAQHASVVIREGEDVTLSVSATDVENDALSYHWTMDGVELDNTAASFDYTGLAVTQDKTVIFSVTASDGDETSAAATINVTVEDRSSGGGLGLFALLLAPLAFLRRRQRG